MVDSLRVHYASTEVSRASVVFNGMAITTLAFIVPKIPTDPGYMTSKLIRNLGMALIGFDEAVNLISFDQVEMFVIYRATSTVWSRSLEC